MLRCVVAKLFLVSALGLTTTPAQLSGHASPELVVQLGHSQAATALQFSPDGRLLVSGSPDDTIRLWEVATGRLLRTLVPDSSVTSLAFSPDSRLLASGSYGHRIHLWDVESGCLVRTLINEQDAILALAFSAD